MVSSQRAGRVLAVVLLVGCETFSDAASDGTNDVDAGSDAAGASDGGAVGPDASAVDDAASRKDASGTERIPTVAAGSVRITPTEITQAQYKAFLDDVAGKTLPQPAVCSWNTSFAPGTGADCVLDANTTPNRPVRCVDWCDAHAYCEWAGLRLCGKIGGGPNPIGAHADPGSSQWFAACGGSANTPYPYGASFNPSSCTFGLPASGPPTDVGGKSACEGGYKGIFDMLGNMGEWEDSCEASTGQTDKCRIRGGYYTYSASNDAIDCATGEAYERGQQSAKFGIRCCGK